MKKSMTSQDFEQFIAINGCDIHRWTTDLNAAARLFAVTDQGQVILAEEIRLNDMLDHRKPSELSDEFLHKIRSIPASPKTLKIKLESLSKNQSIIGKLLNVFDHVFGEISRVYFVGQAAAMAAALFIGITLGMQENLSDGMDIDAQENIDLSGAMFADVSYDLDGNQDSSNISENEGQ